MFDQPPSPPARELTVLDEPLSFPARELTDDENIAWAVMNELVKKPPAPSKNPKIAFLFMTPGALPFEKLWEKFYQVRICFCFFSLRQLTNALLITLNIYAGCQIGVLYLLDYLLVDIIVYAETS